MARGRWIMHPDTKELVPAGEYVRPVKRSSLPAPMLIMDTMDALRSMVDGKMYDSKASLRQHYKNEGYVEMGNDVPDPSTARQGSARIDKQAHRASVEATVESALSKAGFGA